MPQRLIFLFAVLTLLTTICAAKANEPEQPNILWLSTEDIGPHLGCYGYEGISTPNIDAFAKRSLMYRTAWSNYPVCAPARTTIITGMYATALGAGNMRCAAVKPKAVKLLPELMRDAGYYCTNASKTDYNFQHVDGVWDESSRKAHWKNRPNGKPFFAVFNYTKTHESKIRTRPHEQQVDPAAVKLCPYWPDTPEVRQDWAQYLDNIQTMDDWFQTHLNRLDAAGLKEDTIIFFWGDHGSGMPRHKRYAGDSGLRIPLIVHVPEKWKQFYSSNYTAGGQSDWPLGFVDFAPTLLTIADAKIPSHMQGRTFLGSAATPTDYVFGLRNRMGERYDVSRSVTDGRFVYIRNFMPHLPHGQLVDYQQVTPTTSIWNQMYNAGELNLVQSAFWKPRSPEELFDLQADPFETFNLANDSAHQAKLSELRDAVKQKMIVIGDLDLVPESTLYEFEQQSATPRKRYDQQSGFSYEALVDAAAGQNLDENFASVRPEFRYWAIVNALGQKNAARAAKIVKLLDDASMAVQVKAAEFCLDHETEQERALRLLLELADARNSNYFVACNAVDCLERYRDRLSESQVKQILAVPEVFPQFKRSKDNMVNLKRRFRISD